MCELTQPVVVVVGGERHPRAPRLPSGGAPGDAVVEDVSDLEPAAAGGLERGPGEEVRGGLRRVRLEEHGLGVRVRDGYGGRPCEADRAGSPESSKVAKRQSRLGAKGARGSLSLAPLGRLPVASAIVSCILHPGGGGSTHRHSSEMSGSCRPGGKSTARRRSGMGLRALPRVRREKRCQNKREEGRAEGPCAPLADVPGGLVERLLHPVDALRHGGRRIGLREARGAAGPRRRPVVARGAAGDGGAVDPLHAHHSARQGKVRREVGVEEL